MDYTEKDIEDFIYEEGLTGLDFLGRQFKTDFGIIDILAYDAKFEALIVIEIKKGVVDENAIGQTMRYMAALKDLKTYWQNEECDAVLKSIKEVRGILIGNDCTDAVKTIVRNFDFLEFIEYEIFTSVDCQKATHSRRQDSLHRDIKIFNNLLPSLKEFIVDAKAVEVFLKSQEAAS